MSFLVSELNLTFKCFGCSMRLKYLKMEYFSPEDKSSKYFKLKRGLVNFSAVPSMFLFSRYNFSPPKSWWHLIFSFTPSCKHPRRFPFRRPTAGFQFFFVALLPPPLAFITSAFCFTSFIIQSRWYRNLNALAVTPHIILLDG